MMDAIRFLEERNRLCDQFERCEPCPLEAVDCSIESETIKELVEIVEKWSKENPLMTNGRKMMKTLPAVAIVDDGKIDTITINFPRKWWEAEYKGEK